MVADAQGRVIMVNAAAERIFETHRAGLLGRSLGQVCQGLFRAFADSAPAFGSLFAAFRAATQGRPFPEAESLQATFTWGEKTIRCSLAPVYLPEDEPSAKHQRGQPDRRAPSGVVAVFRDITREAAAERAKSRFLATVSHELRTPMTSVKGYLDLLLKGMAGEINATQKRFLGTIKINAERMINVINNMIYISELERAPLQLNVKPTDVAEQIQEAVAAIQEQLEVRDLALSLVVPEDLPPARADPIHLRQVLDNLLSNACKFTCPGGQIKVEARLYEDNGREALLVAVADTGVGIAPAEQEKIFEPFYRAESPLEVEATGVGVGLTIARSLVQAHGGRIWVESQPGQGSVFYFTLPLSRKEAQDREAPFYPQGEIQSQGLNSQGPV